MAKRLRPTAPKQPELIPRCEYCRHNLGENKQFGYMWHCAELSYCVCFGRNFCQAKKQGKGNFKLDEEKLKEWTEKGQAAYPDFNLE